MSLQNKMALKHIPTTEQYQTPVEIPEANMRNYATQATTGSGNLM